VKQALSHVWSLSSVQKPGDLIKLVLVGIAQPSANNEEFYEKAAKKLIEECGGRFMMIQVEELVIRYRESVENALGRKLTWDNDDAALQNIQARVRSPSAWGVANALGMILLTTSNRSEAAVGYATMDGDTSGGLAPLAGVAKEFLISYVDNRAEFSPALRFVREKPPTAGLRPVERTQTDEKDLMPYVVLETIEELAIRDKRSPKDVIICLKQRHRFVTDDQARVWVERFFKLWQQNQWKRERYAPSFHLDDRNLDPKTWCRFPILSGRDAFKL
jgi:NAD+ synthase (glutamine-hydrolysing)